MSGAATTARAQAAALLSHWWSRPVASEVDTWEQAWPLGCELAEGIGADPDAIEALAAAEQGATRDELLDEYERLFVGPGRTPCPPYESLWQQGQPKLEQGHLMGAASAAVSDLYHTLGLDVSPDARELPDHIAIEWEVLACALRGEAEHADQVAAALLNEHLQTWLPSFCAAVREEAQRPFYAELAAVTLSWADALAESNGHDAARSV